MKKIYLFLSMMLITAAAAAQIPNVQWAKKSGGTLDDACNFIKVDGLGNVYTTGTFQGTANFDPGGTFNLTSAGDKDIFISKLNAAGNFVWVKQIGGILLDQALSIAVDGTGNVYTTGSFKGTVDFDPGAGVFNLLAAGIGSNIFISKLDAAGNFVWAKQMVSVANANDVGQSISIDGQANIYTTGSFTGPTDFDPGLGAFNLISAGITDIFVSKLDAAGNFIWAKQMGGTLPEEGLSIAVDGLGNVYTTGVFQGTADFDPGVGSFNLTTAGSRDIFISKLDAAGNFIWAKAMGGTLIDFGSSIAVDGQGNVYSTGEFRGTADFDPGPGTFNLTVAAGGFASNIFISKLDASGNFVWAKQLGSTAASGRSIAVGATGNVYTTGSFAGISDFDPGPGIINLIPTGIVNIFISKLDAAGNYVWAKGIGGTMRDYAYSMTIDSLGNVYTTGTFQATADFGGGGSYNLTSAGGDDIFVAKYTDPPLTVNINQAASQADPTSSSPINFTVVFSETTTNFATGDVTLSGTAGATTAIVTGSGTIYNVAISGMTTSGTVIATIAAGVANDAGGNPNLISTSTDNTVTYNVVDPPPSVTINQAAAQADPTSVSPINFTVVFNEMVTGFSTGDITLSGTAGATSAIVTGSGTTYNVAVSGMTGNGTVIATVPAGIAIDAGSNPNLASTSTDNTVTYNVVDPPPSVTINQATAQVDPSSASPINFTVVFNEIVTGFATGDITLSGTAGATTAIVTGNGTTYNVAVSGMTGNGTVIATVPAGIAMDAGANPNLASTSTDNTVTYNVTIARVNMFPNPSVNGKVNIFVASEMAGAIVKAYDISGLKIKEWIIPGGLNTYTFSWATGIYSLEFKNGSLKEMKRIIIIR